MILILTNGTDLIVKISVLKYWVVLRLDRETDLNAELLANQINKDFGNLVEKIKRDMYNNGWHEAKSKKVRKRTFFSQSINVTTY